MDKKIIRCESTASFASILGSLTSFASTYFVNKFPKGYFKSVEISDSLNSINMQEKDVIKKQTPYISFTPELALDSTYMEQLPQWYTTNRYIARTSLRKNYHLVFSDPTELNYIFVVPSRLKVNYSVKIKTPTTMFMYNLLYFLQTKFVQGEYEYINNVRLQTEIPKHLVINLANALGYDLSDKEQRLTFNDYLTKNTRNGIEENVNLSTGNNNYYHNFISNILINYPDMATTDKNMKNLVVDNGLISFNFSMELWIPNKYIMEIPNKFDITEDEEIINTDNKFKYNFIINTDYIKSKIDNKHLLIKKTFLPDINVEYDELDFSSIMNDELTKTLNVLVNKKLINDNIFDILLMVNNKFLDKEDYDIDYNNFILKTKNPMKNTTYTILLYGDLEKLNKVSNMLNKPKELEELKYL